MTEKETWIIYLIFPLTFAVKWRIKVEEWIKSECEKHELYGSTESIDDDYANTSIMNMSLMSVSSEYSTEDPHSRQTRLFLKRLISCWCNSLYFNDSFYQFNVTNISITFANNVLTHSVPVYLIILALVEPTKHKRKFSIESILSYNKSLLVLYKLNANPSIGLLNLLVCGICSKQQIQKWKNVGQEEAYGIIVCLHLTISALFDQIIYKDNIEKNKLNYCQNHEFKDLNRCNENYKLILNEIKESLYRNISQVLKIALTGLLDPDVVLPMSYFYQNLKKDLKVSDSTIIGCRMILSKNVPFLRYLWSLCQQSVTSREMSFSTSSIERRLSDCTEKSIIFKLLSEGKLISMEDLHRFLSILSTILECVTFHLNTLYQAETRRKSSSSYGPSPAAVCSNFLLWPELWNMTSELAALSIGLIKIAVSLINLKEIDISENHCQCSINNSIKNLGEIIVKDIQSVFHLLRIFYIHIDKLNSDNSIITENFDYLNLESPFSENQINLIFNQDDFKIISKDLLEQNEMKFNEIISLLCIKYLPPFCCSETKLMLIKSFLSKIKSNFENCEKRSKIEEILDFNFQNNSFFKDIFHQLLDKINQLTKLGNDIIVNGERISKFKFIHQILNEGLDPINHLFSCDGNQLLYPNPYVENFYQDYKIYYELLGKIFALNLLYGNGLKKRFSPFFLEKLMFLNETVYNINDLNTVDMEVAKNLLLLSKTDDDLDCFNFKFVLTQNTFGKLHTFEIVENGANIPVTKENKNEYIHNVIGFLLDKQIKTQCEFIRKGMEFIFSVNILRILSTKDLHKLISEIRTENQFE